MKKFLSILLSVCMLVALSGISVSAEPSNTIPSSYDLRDYGYVTSVKSQGVYGTCWVHAICAAAESNMIVKGYADINVDYSEVQLAYYAYNNTTDPLGNFENEGGHLTQTALNQNNTF